MKSNVERITLTGRENSYSRGSGAIVNIEPLPTTASGVFLVTSPVFWTNYKYLMLILNMDLPPAWIGSLVLLG